MRTTNVFDNNKEEEEEKRSKEIDSFVPMRLNIETEHLTDKSGKYVH